jgi:sugar/nucleoside kinase (ribokinase family)
LCAGNISHDILVRPVDHFHWGTNTWITDFVEGMGGNGSNTCFALATLGVPVRLLGMVGNDARGNALLEQLRIAGADTSYVQRSIEPTTTTICVINSAGERLFIQRLGSSLEALSEPTEFSAQLIGVVSHYHQSNLYSLPSLRRISGEQMRRAQQAGLTTSVDTGWATDGRWLESLQPALPFTDLLFVNEQEAAMLTGGKTPAGIARGLRQYGATNIVIKLGGKGSAVFAGGASFHVPPFVVDAVDTTGAGDNFAAGLFAAFHRGLGWRRAAEVANAVGAMAVTGIGATSGVRTWEETLAWIGATPRGPTIDLE